MNKAEYQEDAALVHAAAELMEERLARFDAYNEEEHVFSKEFVQKKKTVLRDNKMKSTKKSTLLLLTICIAAVTLFCAGCRKDSGWKAQSAPNTGSSAGSGDETSAKDSRQSSVKVSSFLHDLFGGELPEDTDRVNLPTVTETRELDIPNTSFEGDAYGSFFYYLDLNDLRVFRLDLETGESSVFTDEVKNPQLVCADTDGVYVCDKGTKEIAYFSFEGERLASVPIPSGNADMKYGSALDHYDGLLLFAVRDGIWTLADGDTEWKRADFSVLTSELIDDAVILTRNRLAVHLQRADHTQERMIEMDANGKNVLDLPGTLITTQSVSSNQGRLWAVDGRTGCRLYEIEDGRANFVQKLSGEGHDFHVVKRAAISNGSILLFWYTAGRVTLMPYDENAPIRFIAPSLCETLADNAIQSVDDIPARYTVYDTETYSDKLNLFLLSGADDFDIALVCDNGMTGMLAPILKNEVYVDLYRNDALKAHISDMFPGARDLIEINGKCPVLPLEAKASYYGYTAAAQESGLALPGVPWNFADLKKLGDSLRGTGMCLFEDFSYLMPLASSAVQANFDLLGDDFGEGALPALRELFSMLEEWREDGILIGGKPVFAQAGISVFGRGGLLDGAETLRLTTLPSADGKGKQPLSLQTYLIVNPNSKNLDAALDYLAHLTDEENRYNSGVFRSPFWPDLTRYYSSGDTGRSSTIPIEYQAFAEKLDAFLPEYYAASALCLVTPTRNAYQAVQDFAEGTISGEDCAKILYEEFVYKLKG